MSDYNTVNASEWLDTLKEKVKRGELGMTAEEMARPDRERLADLEHQQVLRRDRRLRRLKKRVPDHYAWAAKYKRPSWTAIREAMRTAIEATPGIWVLMGTPVGNAKTSGLIYEGARAIVAGRSVRYMAGELDWREAVKTETLHELKRCDLLLVDELHWQLPEWLQGLAMGVIDWRYQRRHHRQTLGAGTAPIEKLKAKLPPGLADRFDVHLGGQEASQRRKS